MALYYHNVDLKIRYKNLTGFNSQGEDRNKLPGLNVRFLISVLLNYEILFFELNILTMSQQYSTFNKTW